MVRRNSRTGPGALRAFLECGKMRPFIRHDAENEHHQPEHFSGGGHQMGEDDHRGGILLFLSV